MLHRFSNLMILASWSFAWFSAAVHVHSGHDCHHGSAVAVGHTHSHTHTGGTHSHCHAHHGSVHRHAETPASPNGTSSDKAPSIAGKCVLCDLNALELVESPIADVEPCSVIVSAASVRTAEAPESSARYALRGRAPPIC
jgi:hypothetical protein